MTKVKVLEYHLLNLIIDLNRGITDVPTDEIPTILQDIMEKSRGDKFMELKTSKKYMYLQSVDDKKDSEGRIKHQKVIFHSFKTGFTPDLIDSVTAELRNNPKELTEGEKNKTHLVISYKYDYPEVSVCLEKNGNGVNMQQIVTYLNKFLRRREENLKEEDENYTPNNYHFGYATIAHGDFKQQLKKFKQVKLGEIHLKKQILGSSYMNMSDRTVAAKETVTLKITSKTNRSLEEIIVDAFSDYDANRTDNRKNVTRIFIKGDSEEGSNLHLDTEFLHKVKSVKAQLNTETGEVMSTSFFSQILQSL